MKLSSPKLFRHYKDKNYRYLGTVRHSETLEELAHYECLYENDLGAHWVRPKEMFFGEIEIDGKKRRRFSEVAIELQVSAGLGPREQAALDLMGPRIFEVWDAKKVERRLSHQKGLLLQTAWEGGSPIGFKIGYEISPDVYYSWLGGVVPEYRRLGIAQALMRAQHGWCREQGYCQVETKTKNSRKSMLLLNIREGFDIVGTEPSKDGGEAKIVLRKNLCPKK